MTNRPAGSDSDPGLSPGTVADEQTPPRTPWQRYIDLIRELDTERITEETRTAGQQQGSEAAALQVEHLAPLLIDQGAELSRLARRLRIGQPKLAAEPADPARSAEGSYQLAVQATQLTARAASFAREAHSRAARPRFLPGVPAGLRNGLIYLGWAALGLLVQLAILRQNQAASSFPILFGVPSVTFLAGLVSVATVGRAPLSAQRPGRSVRVGVLICFGLFPVVMILYLVRHFIHSVA